jgi:hypothetical protein
MSIPKPVVAIFKAKYKHSEPKLEYSNDFLSRDICKYTECIGKEFKTITELLEETSKLKPNHYDNIIIMSHGNKNCLAVLGQELCALRGWCGGYTKEFISLSENLEKALKVDGEIWLYACKTGEVTTFFNNFATSLARLSNRTVYGTTKSLYGVDNICANIDKNGRICIITNSTCQNEKECETYDDSDKDFIRFPKSAFKKSAKKKSTKKKSTKKKSKVLNKSK